MTPNALRKRMLLFCQGKGKVTYARILSTIAMWSRFFPQMRLPARELRTLLAKYPTLELDVRFCRDMPFYEHDVDDRILDGALLRLVPEWARKANPEVDVCAREGCGHRLRDHLLRQDFRRDLFGTPCFDCDCPEHLPAPVKEKARGRKA